MIAKKDLIDGRLYSGVTYASKNINFKTNTATWNEEEKIFQYTVTQMFATIFLSLQHPEDASTDVFVPIEVIG